MSGLRERQKEKRRKAILKAATTLFLRNGFDSVAVEDIAAKAGLSTGTVYNYFTNKAEILVTIAAVDIEEFLEECEAVIANGRLATATAVLRIYRSFFEWSLARYDRSLARPIAFLQLGVAGRELAYLEGVLEQPLRALIRAHHRSGKLRADLDLDACARVLFNLSNSEYYTALADERRGVDEILRRLETQVAAVIQGWLPG